MPDSIDVNIKYQKLDYRATNGDGYVYNTLVDSPTTIGQTTYGGGGMDAFITKLSADGSDLIYSTYLGGSAQDFSNGIAIDYQGCAYVVGETQSKDFPITEGAYQTTHGGGTMDVFVTKISKSGSFLEYSTYIGGGEYDAGRSIVVDSKGYAYIAGYTDGDIIFIKISIDGSKLINYTHLNNGIYDYGKGIALDAKGNVYIIGYAESNYPTTTGVYQTKCAGHNDVIVSKIQLIDFDISLNYNQNEVKLLDIIKTELKFTNSSPAILNVNIKFQPLDSSVLFVENTLSIQNISRLSRTIPSEIYLSNIEPEQTANIEFDLNYIKEKYPKSIPIQVTAEIYDTTSTLITSITKTFYIATTVGSNYIPGCNKELYNLENNGKLQTTLSGVPIIYYKSGTSYVYRETNGGIYVYKVLESSDSIVEYKISD